MYLLRNYAAADRIHVSIILQNGTTKTKERERILVTPTSGINEDHFFPNMSY
jgi:hypothetical protein